jgi:hypothetical protein
MSLSQSILNTVAFFDIFDYPLSAFEIWQYISEPTSLQTVIKTLETLPSGLENHAGFYFLSGRAQIIHIRRERYLEANKKIKKARRRLALISWLPGIELISLANIIGSHNLRKSSDTDLFIITKPHRLWLVKFSATIILKIFGLRPTPQKNTDQLCLSFLTDTTALDLSVCQTNNDLYFTYWFTGLLPLYGNPDSYNQLMAANPWLKTRLPNWQSQNSQPRYYFKTQLSNHPPYAFFNSLEKLTKKIQERVMSPSLKNLANQSTQVIINDHMLKLHTIDRREHFMTEYNKRLSQINLHI